MQRGMNEGEGMLYKNYHTQKTKKSILEILDKTHTQIHKSRQPQEIFSNITFAFINSIFSSATLFHSLLDS